mgnify:CR=1 FL=1
MIERFLPRTEFSSYEDLNQNYKVIVPEDFNFSFDVIDQWAKEQPNKPALVWCDDQGNEERLSFSEVSRRSCQVANFFAAQGIRKGDAVMLILSGWKCGFLFLHCTVLAPFVFLPPSN